MQLAVLASPQQRALLEQPGSGVQWAGDFDALMALEADVYMDLLFEYVQERIRALSSLKDRIIVVNAVAETLPLLPEGFVRVNAWPGFLAGKGLETCWKNTDESILEKAFALLGKKPVRVPDIPGMVAPRTVAMIVNEAYYAWGEGVSSKEHIDTAMQLGTNYPYGPFAWAHETGLKNIYALLRLLAATDERYLPAPALENEMNASS